MVLLGLFDIDVDTSRSVYWGQGTDWGWCFVFPSV